MTSAAGPAGDGLLEELQRLRERDAAAVAYIFGDHSAEKASWWHEPEDESWQVYRRGEKLAGGMAKERAVEMAKGLHKGAVAP